MREEMGSIRAACSNLTADYKPGITFIVVQKRHHTRFFPQNTRRLTDNVPPGTVVDRVVTPQGRPGEWAR